MSVPVFSRGGFFWKPLVDSDIAALIGVLDHPDVSQWLGPVAKGIVRRRDMDLSGRAITLVAHDEHGPAGWAGILDYPAHPNAIQSSVYLAPEQWGSGLVVIANALAYAMTRALDHDTMFVSIHRDNTRSQRAHTRLFPTAKAEWVEEPWKLRRALVLAATTPPLGASPLSSVEMARFEKFVSTTPMGLRMKETA
jgi:hypothetical protein